MKIRDWVFTIFATIWVLMFFAGISAVIVFSELDGIFAGIWIVLLGCIGFTWFFIDGLLWRQ